MPTAADAVSVPIIANSFRAFGEASLAVQSGVQPAGEPEQPDESLRVATFGDRLVQPAQRPRDDLDPLVLLAFGARLVKARGVEEVNALVGEAGAGIEADDRLPALRSQPHLLSELPLRGLERTLAVHVETSGGDLEQFGLHRLAWLAHEPHVLLVVGDDADGATVPDDLACDLLPVDVAEALDAHLHEPSAVDGLRAEPLHAPRPRARAPATRRTAGARARPALAVGAGGAHAAPPTPVSTCARALDGAPASSASAVPPASAAPKNSGSSVRRLPIVT